MTSREGTCRLDGPFPPCAGEECMAKGGRANLERLLRRAWEMQKQKKLFSKTRERTSFDWRDLLLAGLALFTETLALLVGISILAHAAAILFWFAIRNYRKERHLSWSTQRGITCGVFVMLVTMLPVVFNSYRGRHLGPTEAKVSSSASNSEPANREPSAPTAPLTAKEIADEVARRLPTVDADASDKKDVSIKKSSGFLQLLDLEILRPGIVAGKPILINFYLENRGSEPVYQASRFFGMQFIPVNQNEPNKTDEKFFADARKHRIKEKTQVDNSVGVGEKIWNTLSNNAPTPEQSQR